MSVFFYESDILKILTGRKVATCRKYPLNIGNQYSCMVAFKVFAVIEITAVTYIPDITKINSTVVRKLGYKTRKEYLKENYNKNNESKERYLMEFKVIENRINDYINNWKC